MTAFNKTTAFIDGAHAGRLTIPTPASLPGAAPRLPLTAAQLGVWTAQELEPSSPRYNCAAYVELHGALDEAQLEAALRIVLGESEALRARFDDGAQIVEPVPAHPLERVDTRSAADPRGAAEAWMRVDLGRAVDLRSQPAVRHAVIQDGPDSRLLYLRHHHVALDGYGQALHLRRLAEVYSALVTGAPPPPASSAPLAAIVDEDRDYAASAAADGDRAYWKRVLPDRPEALSLSGLPAGHASRVLRRTATLARDEVAELHALAGTLRTTPSAVVMAAVAAYVARITGRDRVMLAVPVSARRSKAARATPAMLANQLPLVVQIDPPGAPGAHDGTTGTGFAELVAQVTARLVELARHQRYRGEDLHRELGLAGTSEQLGSPTVNVITFVGDLWFGGAHGAPRFLSAGPVRDLALHFLVAPDGSKIRLVADADADRFSAAALASHVAHLLALLRDACRRPDAPVGSLALMTAAEREAVLRAGTGAVRDYDLGELGGLLHERVAAQVQRTPAAIAVEVAGQALSYSELFERAGRLAQHLQTLGAGPGRVVGVHDERSLDLVVELLAVLRAGAAYLPLDPELPPQRLQFQIEDAGAAVVLSRSDLQHALAGVAVPVLAVDRILPGLPAATRLARGARPGDAAYVIYTSGSTGRPKGVAVPHRGVVNRLLWMQDEYGLGGDDRVLQKTPFTFDVSVWELFWPLVTGARLHVAPPGAHRDPRALAEIIRRHEITTLHFVPTMLDLFLAEPEAARLPSIRRVFASGEALNPETVGRFYAVYGAAHGGEPGAGPAGPPLHNLYGPTEASIDVTYWPCQPGDAAGVVPIGRAIANTSIHILGPGGELVPFGVPGELHIGGVQVAIGYVHRPELTAERFIGDRFGATRLGAGTLYRTGDLAVLRPDGVVEYLGRIDHQVKIRGFRVELGEIEATLLAHPAVAQAVVVAPVQPDGTRRLVAYVVPAGAQLDTDELLAMARTRLPEYMVPAQVSVQPSLPQLSSGKVDRKALPAVSPVSQPGATGDARACEPGSEAERLLHDVWCDVLGHRRLDVGTSFFALGGDSILSIKMRAAVERHGYTFAVAELFAFPTVRELAGRLVRFERSHDEPRTAAFALVQGDDRAAMPADVEDAYPLSSLQAGIVFHAGYEDASSVYRVVTSVQLGLRFDEPALRRAIEAVVRRHPALRSSLHLTGFHEPLQLVHREAAVVVERRDELVGRPRDEQDRELRAWAERAKFHDFDLTRAPLVRFTAHRRDDQSFQLTAVEHHAVIDGWSDMAMFDEVVARYQAQLAGDELWLPEVPSTFHRFIAAERRVVAAADHRRFWHAELAGVEPSQLPRSSSLGRRGRAHHRRFDVVIDAATAAQLIATARRLQLPLKSLLAASHLAVLHAVCPGAEVVTGVVSHARLAEPGGDQVIGLFLNTLPLRAQVSGASWVELARGVHDHEGRTAPHRGYPYGQMVRDIPGLTLDSYVNFMDFHRPGDGQTAVIGGFGIAETDFPLAVDFLVDPVRGRLEAWLDCDLGVLDAAFCERLTGYYQRALIAAAGDPERVASALDLRGAEERRIVAAWSETRVAYDAAATIHAGFAEQAQRTPEAIALSSGDDRLCYAELDARAWQLAHYLRQQGAARGSRIGVHVRRGSDLVVTLLACLRSGAAYVPLDPDFPRARLDYVMTDAALHCVVTGDADGPLAAARAVCLPACAAAIAACPTTALGLADGAGAAGGDDVAYVMYTSGSTGFPKGTAVRHRNVVNFFTGMDRRIGVGPGDRLLALTSISFDISVLELLWPLVRGGEVVVAPERMIDSLVPGGDRTSFAELCLRHRPTLVQATPSLFAAVASLPEALQALGGARALLIGGEAFPAGLARQLLAALPAVQIFNMYGPTETTVWSTVHELDRARDAAADVLPIGRPIANTQLRIADARGEEAPLGVAGELWIGGAGVAVGYRGMPELTADRFVAGGAAELAGGGAGQRGEPAQRWYRTGDRVRWRDDGILEFLGRFDRQVKVAGHRIELDEIESVLSRHPEVASVAVIAAPRAGGGPELIAFVAPSGAAAGGDAQRAHVARWQEVWELAYAAPATAAAPAPQRRRADDDFAGWLSSYTGDPIARDEMRSWLAHGVARCAALGPRRIVDVGVGVGLFLRALAPRCETYLGIDVSEAALRRAQAALAATGARHGQLTLQCGDALVLEGLPDGSADLVLLNSVVQYFPSAAYLRRVLAHAVRVAGPSGAVFVGDVRDLALLGAFHAHVQLQRADALTPAPEVAAAARRARADERELCLARELFAELAASDPAIGEVRIELKPGVELNELTRFRYDVTLLGQGRAQAPRGDRVSRRWSELAGSTAAGAAPTTVTTVTAVTAQLASLPPELTLTVVDVPNPRLAEPLAALALLDAGTQDLATAWDLQRALWERASGDAGLLEQLRAVGERARRRTTLAPAASGEPGCFDVVFAPQEPAKS